MLRSLLWSPACPLTFFRASKRKKWRIRAVVRATFLKFAHAAPSQARTMHFMIEGEAYRLFGNMAGFW